MSVRVLVLALLFCTRPWDVLSFQLSPSLSNGKHGSLPEHVRLHRLHSSEQEDDDWSLGVNKEEVDAFVQSVLEDMTKGMNDSKQIEYILSRRWASPEAHEELEEYAAPIQATVEEYIQKVREDIASENVKLNETIMKQLDSAMGQLREMRVELFESLYNVTSQKLDEKRYRSTTFPNALMPVCVVVGPGPVGKAVGQMLQELNVDLQLLDCDRAEFMEDKQLRSLMLEKRTVMFCGDETIREQKSGKFSFLQSSYQQTRLSSKLILRILNIFYQDNEDFLAFCKKRGIEYTVVRTGDTVYDPMASKTSSGPTIVVTPGDVTSGTTTMKTAASALVQCMGVPASANSIFSIVNTAESLQYACETSSQEWEEELLKLEGPEVLRIRILKADPAQVAIWMRSWADQWTESNTPLNTPVEVSKFQNGLRFLFRPFISTYMSKREEREAEEREERRRLALGGKQPTLYNKLVRRDVEKENIKRKKKEGGLEVIVETEPYTRVRARRCNMEEGSVLKDTSEQALLRSLRLGLQALEDQISSEPLLKSS